MKKPLLKGPDDFELLRWHGKQPSAKERWKAFYRLYRGLLNSRSAQEMEQFMLDFRVLMYDWRWIKLVQAVPDSDIASAMPRELRQMIVDLARRRRAENRCVYCWAYTTNPNYGAGRACDQCVKQQEQEDAE